MRVKPMSVVSGILLALLLTLAPIPAYADEALQGQIADEETANVAESVEEASDAPVIAEGVGAVVDQQAEVEGPVVTDGSATEPQPAEGDDTETTSDANDTTGATVADGEGVASGQDQQEPEDISEAADAQDAGIQATEASTEASIVAQGVPESEAQKKLDQLAKDHANDLPAGRYAITSNATPSVSGDKTTYSLDVKGASKSAGAQIILYKAKVSDNQRWDVAILESGYATIKSVASGLYLSLSNGDNAFSGGAYPTVEQQAYKSGAKWQQWVIVKQSDGSFKLISALLRNGTTQCAFDVMGGRAKSAANTIAFPNKTSGNDNNQKFTFSVTTDILDSEAKQHKDDLSEDTYILASSLNKSYKLNMQKASMDNGGAAILYAGTTAVNEGWDIVIDQDSGYVTIVNSKSGKVLDVSGGKAVDGTKVIQWAEKNNQRNQQWIAIREADGTYKFVSALAGNVRYVLSVHSGKAAFGEISIKADKGAAAKDQHWSADGAPEQYAYAHAVKDGTYMIRTALDITKVLDVARSSKDDGAQVNLWTAKRSDNQYWILTHDNQGYVLLKNKNSGKYLAFSTKLVDGYRVTVQSTASHRWIAQPSNSGNFALIDPSLKKVADVCRSSTANGTKVIAYKQNANTNQMWVIANDIKIAIDPGHGANDSGAVGNGLNECDLNWKIAQACATQLRAYGFDVFMTMTQSEFKNTGITTPSIKTRVERAYNAGAIAIFSMHINAGGGSSANGAEVLVPNGSSFHKEFYTMGQAFTKDVLARIKSATGIASRGAVVRNYSAAETDGENQYYTGGGYADYYGIIRYARLRGMFGVIIEHGFITNARDAQILSASTTKLGQADAAAIKNLYK